jgi:glycyl-tRNA synthetase beta chain
LANMAERAARLAKADLVTGMVGEFPELQGLIGGYYAAAQGEPAEVAEAVRDHYKPVGQGDDVPTAPATVAVALADKLDTLAQFFAVGELPTGSKDPFALRRSSLGILAISQLNGLRMPLDIVLAQAMTGTPVFDYARPGELIDSVSFTPALVVDGRSLGAMLKEALAMPIGGPIGSAWRALVDQVVNKVRDTTAFFADRLKVQQREAGVRHDLIDAVFALGGEDDLVRLLARVHALQAFVTSADGKNLLAGYKRAANILKKENWAPGEVADNEIYEAEPAEAALREALDAAEPKAEAAIEAEDFEAAMAALATLRGPIDAFFETVTVVDPDQFKREMRLGLLARIRDAVNNVADFSKIEG